MENVLAGIGALLIVCGFLGLLPVRFVTLGITWIINALGKKGK